MPRSPRQNAIAKLHNVRRPRNILVGADDPVRPWGNCEFAVAFHKNGRAPYGSMWASTPTNILRIRRWCIRFCRCVLPGGQRRPPLQGCARVRTVRINLLHCTGGRGKPLPYVTTKRGSSSKRTTLPLISRLRRQLPPRGKPWIVQPPPAFAGGGVLAFEGLLGGEEGFDQRVDVFLCIFRREGDADRAVDGGGGQVHRL